jgi:hypothetical protein
LQDFILVSGGGNENRRAIFVTINICQYRLGKPVNNIVTIKGKYTYYYLKNNVWHHFQVP